MQNTIATNDILLFMTVGIGVILLLSLAFVLFFHFSQKSLQKQISENQALQIAHQNDLLKANIISQEKERKRIAKDLHDTIGSNLNVILLNIHHLKKDLPPQTTESLSDVVGLLNKTVETTRRISHDLLPPTLENFGLATALEEFCEQIQKNTNIKLILEIGEQLDLPKTTALQLFRIIQELVSNSLKHSEAQQISIRLFLQNSLRHFQYQDDGKGFDATQISQQKGLGMRNLESRFKLLEADWEMETGLGKGFKITAKF